MLANEIGGTRMFNVVSIRQRYAGHTRQAGYILSQYGVGAYMSRYDPELDIDIIKRGMDSRNDPISIAYPYKAPFNSKAIIDRLPAYDFPREFPEVAEASKELQDKVRVKWQHILD